MKKAESGNKIVISAIGGSITEGARAGKTEKSVIRIIHMELPKPG